MEDISYVQTLFDKKFIHEKIIRISKKSIIWLKRNVL